MVYRITVDGKRKYAEAPIKEYSLEADNLAREGIIRHFLDDEGAKEVLFDTTVEEASELHNKAKEFYDQLLEYRNVWNDLPEEKPWGVNEMFKLTPQLMRIYALAMDLPYPEYTEDAEYEEGEMFSGKDVRFEGEYISYWAVAPYRDRHGDGEVFEEALWEDFVTFMPALKEGVGAYEAGLVCESLFTWRYYILQYCGRHIRNAITAMGEVCEKAERKRKKRDYWVQD